jgi:hypothetical protein
MAISRNQYELAFRLSESLVDGTATINELASDLSNQLQMHGANARHYFTTYCAMRRGESFLYSTKDAAVEFALSELHANGGAAGLRTALRSVDGYLAEYERVKGERRPSLRDLLQPWRSLAE